MYRQGILTLLVGVAAGNAWFRGDFDDGQLAPFVLSENERYTGQNVQVQYGTLVLEEANHFYGIGAKIEPPFKAATLVAQFEVTLTDGLSCGGAYIKLLEDTPGLDVNTFDDKTPFVIMFGPDKCGTTDKVHFIIRQQNKVSGEWFEHHLKEAPRAVPDKKVHLYTLIILEDDSFEILIDGDPAKKGNLMDAFEPPLMPAKEIDDPDDTKPEDWVDAAKIPDPDATKPDDWDEDAPRTIDDADAVKPKGWLDDEASIIPDPQAERPEDWDDDEDGEWEAPEIPNPKCTVGCGEWTRPKIQNPNYKGKWSAPMIDNPEYKGVWAPRKIPNPHYFLVEKPSQHLPPIGAYVVDVWTTNKGITFDTFLLSTQYDDAKDAADSFLVKKNAEAYAEQQKKEAKKQKKLQERLENGNVWTQISIMVEPYLIPAYESFKAQPILAFTTVCVVIFTLIFLYKSNKKNPKPDAPTTTTPPTTEQDDAKDEDDDQQEREKPPMDDD